MVLENNSVRGYAIGEERGDNSVIWLAILVAFSVGTILLQIYLYIHEHMISDTGPGKGVNNHNDHINMALHCFHPTRTSTFSNVMILIQPSVVVLRVTYSQQLMQNEPRPKLDVSSVKKTFSSFVRKGGTRDIRHDCESLISLGLQMSYYNGFDTNPCRSYDGFLGTLSR